MRLCLVGLCAAVVFGSRPLMQQAAIHSLIQDPPALQSVPGAPEPDEEGVIVEEVVNVHKSAIVVVWSSMTDKGFERRDRIRRTWAQALNRSSEFAMSKEDRRSLAVWFLVPIDPANQTRHDEVVAEGRLNGDILLVKSAFEHVIPTDYDVLGAFGKWIRVAYYERFDFAVLTQDTAFVSLYNLLKFTRERHSAGFLYTGHVESFEHSAFPEHGHKYYAPYVARGTMIMSANVINILARELVAQPMPFDAAVGTLMNIYEGGRPKSNDQIVTKLTGVYEEVPDVILIRDCPVDLLESLSKPKCGGEGCHTPALPAQTTEMKSISVYIDPHYKVEDPLCDGVDAAKCKNLAELLMNSATNGH